MSLVLYRLGALVARYKGWIVAAWFLVLVLLGGAAVALGANYDDAFSVPGTESQQGQDVLSARFGQTGTSGVVLFTAKSGKITGSKQKNAVEATVKSIGRVSGVSMSDPLNGTSGELSKDHRAVIGGVQFSSQNPSDHTLDAVIRAARQPAGSAITTSVGGNAYGSLASNTAGGHAGDLIGLVVAFFILAITFGSFIAAGMPLLTAIAGVAATLTGVMVLSHVATISSTSPTLAEMLGLAVAIDYSLFILSRHRGQLAEGVPVVESMQRALSTAGSAVVFAGVTVIIAVSAMVLVGIPVLSVMGLAAAAAVAVAVVAALTLLPAVSLLLGRRLIPKPKRAKRQRKRKKNAPKDGEDAVRRRERVGFATWWERLITRVPLVTVVVVVLGLGVLSVPTLGVSLALPDNSTAAPSTPQRQTYDAITREFGVGYNAPLSVTADIITSTDPKKTVNDLADGLRKIDGVAAVPTATPNEGGDTALLQVIPERGQTDPSTADLVNRIRNDAPSLEKKYHVTDLLVTGQTAVNIDVSSRLTTALVPFAAVVVGMSIILLLLVFRSIAVPLTATAGYLLSVGTALGAVVTVFQEGRLFTGLLGDVSPAPIVSFLPIFVMGVLFGLAMDYEMFLVSRMREAYVATDDARRAVADGFRSSSPVVTAAALIMTSVFASFVPTGSTTVKPIAFGLAVGVLTDAFVVRMTLMPALLALLGRHAWWLPRWLDRALPVVDVEGEVLHRILRHRTWKQRHSAAVIHAPRLEGRELTVTLNRPAGVVVGDLGRARLLGRQLCGRAASYPEDLTVDDLLLPEQQEAVRRRTALIDVPLLGAPPTASVDRIVAERARLLTASPSGRSRFRAQVNDLWELLDRPATDGDAGGSGSLSVTEAAALEAAIAVAAGAITVVFVVSAERLGTGRNVDIASLAARLTHLGVASVVVADRFDDATAAWLDVVDLTGHLAPGAATATTLTQPSEGARDNA